MFFAFNPFDAGVMTRLKARLAERGRAGIPLRFVYYCCRHIDVFSRDPDWRVTYPRVRAFPTVALITYAPPAAAPELRSSDG